MENNPNTKNSKTEDNRDSETHMDVVKESEETYKYQHGLLIDKLLDPPSYEYPIKPSDLGLFVIIKNIEFHYEHRLTKMLGTFKNFKEQYNEDFKKLKETFKFEENASNVRYAEDLVADGSPDQKSQKFDEFMQQRVLGYEGDPKFVMVVLMSHGLSNGVFVLGEKENKKSLHRPCCKRHLCDRGKTKKAKEGKVSCCQEAPHECCALSPGELHTQMGACRERRIKEDLIEPLQTRFPKIPKIFLLQVCRGDKEDDVLKASGEEEQKTTPQREENDMPQREEDDTSSFDFLLGTSNSLVLYAGAEGQKTWVAGKGSLLILEFCEAVNGLKERLKKVSAKLDKLKNQSENNGTDDEVQLAMNSLLSEMKGQHPDPNITVSTESVVGGWFEDICRMTAANVARRYMIEEKGINQHSNGNKELVSRKALTKSQPEVRSSLHRKLSCIKMMRTQDESWGKPDTLSTAAASGKPHSDQQTEDFFKMYGV